VNGKEDEVRKERDGRFHDFLDGDPGERGTPDESFREEAAAIGKMETWLRKTRRNAPAGLAANVERAIAGEGRARRKARTGAPRSLRRWWAGAAAIAAAAAAVFVLFRSDGDAPAPVVITPANEETLVAHEFLFRADQAEEVCLVGGFNRWKVCDTPLRPAGEGLWKVTLQLPAGRHEYMFVVDSEWRTDPSAPFHTDDGFGNRNAVVHLET